MGVNLTVFGDKMMNLDDGRWWRERFTNLVDGDA